MTLQIPAFKLCDVQLWTEEWGQDSYDFVPAPQIVLQCIWWHSHLTGITFQSVPYDWILCFLPICGNGALFPSSQAYFHLDDLSHLPGAPHHYPVTPSSLPAKDAGLYITLSAVAGAFDAFLSETVLLQ